MRVLLAALLVASVGLSGCAVKFDFGDGEANIVHNSSTCMETTNGVTRPCGESANLTFEPVSVNDVHAMEPTNPTTASYGFGVGHNAMSSVRVVWSGADDSPARAGEPCIRLDGPSKAQRGDCGGTNVNIVIGANTLLQDEVYIDAANLRPGKYSLSVEAPPGVGDIHVDIQVSY